MVLMAILGSYDWTEVRLKHKYQCDETYNLEKHETKIKFKLSLVFHYSLHISKPWILT